VPSRRRHRHDFNNVLAGVFAYGEMIFEETPMTPPQAYAKNCAHRRDSLPGAGRQILAFQPAAPARTRTRRRHAMSCPETLGLLRGSLPVHHRR